MDSIRDSWGSGNSLPFNASLPTVLASFNRNYGDFYKPVLDKDVLVVFSAGNGYGVHAGIDAAAPLNDPRLRSNWLSVANYSSFTAADPSTSFCGQTATWCVAGPGSAVVSSVPAYTMDRAGILALYPRANYAGLYSATTVTAACATARWASCTSSTTCCPNSPRWKTWSCRSSPTPCRTPSRRRSGRGPGRFPPDRRGPQAATKPLRLALYATGGASRTACAGAPLRLGSGDDQTKLTLCLCE